MSEPFLGEIKMVGFGFAPRGWAKCEGQLLPISQNTALFSLLGTTFGGDGRKTFGLPDLRARGAVGVGNGPGLDSISWGEKGGDHEKVLSVGNLPSHNHSYNPRANSGAADSDTPVDSYPAVDEGATESYHSESNATMGTSISSSVGNNQPFNIRNPFLGIYHVIALQGIFPSRN